MKEDITMWKNFEYNTFERMASNKGHIRAMVNTRTGEIIAYQNFGLMSYGNEYKLNIKNKVNTFPYTTEDKIILDARRIVEQRSL